MNIISTRIQFTITLIKCRNFANKRHWKILKRDTEVYDLTTDKPDANLLSVFGVAGTGALGIKRLINGKLFDEIP